jgi:hypothetical protein
MQVPPLRSLRELGRDDNAFEKQVLRLRATLDASRFAQDENYIINNYK